MSLNVGILGHVDCGKTTLTRALAELASTGAFDKHAEKGGRKNTLDLGFSCVTINGSRLALVDCPGHAGLIRAVLAASTVFDMAIVVIDASCGIQPQTAEHLLLCSIFCPSNLVVVLNKIDLVPEGELTSIISKLRKGLKAVGVNDECPVVPLSLLNTNGDSLKPLLDVLAQIIFTPRRNTDDSLLLAVDHCFAIKGKGTVLTGTVIQGKLRLNDEIEFPLLKERRKVKGLESWKQQVTEVSAGERAAVLLQNLNADNISRTMVCSPGSLGEIHHCLVNITPISFYKGTVNSGSKMHISIGFEMVMAVCSFIQPVDDTTEEFEQLTSINSTCRCLLSFDRPVFANKGMFLIASKLDHQGKGCRFTFHGIIVDVVVNPNEVKRFVRKEKRGVVERIENGRSLICSSLFKKETKFALFEGMDVSLSSGETGRIEGSFGKSGKARIAIPGGLSEAATNSTEKVEVVLKYKKYLGDRSIKSYL